MYIPVEVENIFNRLVDEIRTLIHDFGRILTTDSKAIHSLARGPKRDKNGKAQKPDGRRDTKHFIRGLQKMKLRCALMVMLAMAVGRIREKQGIHIRSLVKAA